MEPGVVRDELNIALKPYDLFFAPETATSNRCCIGGMCGNNSCGANSLIYGSTRHHILEMDTVLSDGSPCTFKAIDESEFKEKCLQNDWEGEIYRSTYNLLKDKDIQDEIREQFPDPSLQRRSMGYAIDELIAQQPFSNNPDKPFNFCTLLVGSEGTLSITTKIKVKLSPLPAPHKALLCVENNSMDEALQVNLTALQHSPSAVELIDDLILELAKQNITQQKNRDFIQGNPKALIVIEIIEKTEDELNQKLEIIRKELENKQLGYAYTVIRGEKMQNVWSLRKAGLGIMSNAKGDSKPVTVVEDIAISPEKYVDYFHEFEALLAKYDLKCAYYAHISTGELHNKPLFNLKKAEEVEKIRQFAHDASLLVKKYGGSLSGEHGDGRLRGEFLPLMVGEQNYRLFIEIKKIFDPNNLLNVGKIVNTPPMNSDLRYAGNENCEAKYHIKTMFDFSDTDGILRAIEKCNGSGDCKRSSLFDGAMCPSYRATKDEKYATRARANLLREFLTHSTQNNPFDHKEIAESLDLCLACKACKSECPSNVDMTKIRAEFLYHYYQQHPIPLRSRIIAYYPYFNLLGMKVSHLFNFACNNRFLSTIIKKVLGFSTRRSLPPVAHASLKKWAKKNLVTLQNPIKTVYFFNDEFTNTQDVAIGIKAVQLLQKLNYQVRIIDNHFSGRTFLSKGFLKKAKSLAEKNVNLYAEIINDDTPLLGLEPSAILSFRDEYLQLVSPNLQEKALKLSKNCFLIDEFIADEFEKGNIQSSQFTDEKRKIIFHSHCYQKALSNTKKSVIMMQIPINYAVTELKDGCCGMAGAFGYEKEHYNLSMKIGNLTLFPAIQQKEEGTIITATGTSCRHQIKDGTHECAMHPIEILYDGLRK
ncbi:MAG: FAD-linked oxidase C-terminal domain-containing protein [Bacteroidales bacterium]|nr:FAD-linked oxidase C-terminal domain-containing protein [Bacteroidales bacterium]